MNWLNPSLPKEFGFVLVRILGSGEECVRTVRTRQTSHWSGFSSFDQFENFEERGEFFERIVLDLKSHAFKSTQLELN